MFGIKEDFSTLCKEAEKYGIKIVLDGVFNHVGSSSKYFNIDKKYGEGGAYNDKNSPYRDWFYFHDDNSYDCWWSFPTLPRINAQSKGAQKYFCGANGIVPRWLKAGASGWRLDVVDEIADCMLDKIVSSAKKQNPRLRNNRRSVGGRFQQGGLRRAQTLSGRLAVGFGNELPSA